MARIEKIVIQGFKSFKRRATIPFPSGISVITGPNGAGKCLRADALVQLADGSQVPIGELAEQRMGDAIPIDDGFVAEGSVDILTMDFETLRVRPAKATKFIKRTSPGKLLKLRTQSGREVVATPYHPLFIMTDAGIKSAEAGELKEGVRVAVPRSLPAATGSPLLLE